MNIGEGKYIKLLFITRQNFLHNDRSGGYKLSQNIFQSLKENDGIEVSLCILDINGCKISKKNGTGQVKIISIKDKPIKRNLSYLLGGSGYSFYENMALRTVIRTSDADIIWFDGTWFGRHIREVSNWQKTVVFCHNIEKIFAMDRILTTKKITAVPRFISDWVNERAVIKRADRVICLNERDDLLLNRNYGRRSDEILPIMLRDAYAKCRSVENRTNEILFVGSSFYPNIEGIRWFCKNIMPYVECKLDIVGNGMESIRDELESEKVRIVGTVDSLQYYYDKADLVVLPLFSGGGMKVKTAEAMMYGKRILASDEALEGYQIEGMKDIIRCNTASEFIHEINYMMRRSEISKFSEENRKLFLESYSTASAKKKIYKLLGELMDEKN